MERTTWFPWGTVQEKKVALDEEKAQMNQNMDNK